jgi:hypothetical protein
MSPLASSVRFEIRYGREREKFNFRASSRDFSEWGRSF